ncbi:MAG: hypothetical protein ABEJ46_01890, partial [Gemmatimonadota bacterium]
MSDASGAATEAGRDLLERLERIHAEGVEALEGAGDEEELEQARVTYLGRSGEVAEVTSGIGDLPPEDRPVV